MVFECHITIQVPVEREQQLHDAIVDSIFWKFSRITGDPLLGQGIFCYATSHFTDAAMAIQETKLLSEALDAMEFFVARRKIEIVMMDERKVFGVWKHIT